MRKILYFFLILRVLSFGNDMFEGYWMPLSEKFIIKIYKNDLGTYEGVIVWLKDPTYPEGDKDAGKIKLDRKNPDETLRNRSVLGLKIAGDLIQEGDRLKDGWIYDSSRGKIYNGSAKVIEKDLLRLRGSLDKSKVFGKSLKVKRVKLSEIDETKGKLEVNNR